MFLKNNLKLWQIFLIFVFAGNLIWIFASIGFLELGKNFIPEKNDPNFEYKRNLNVFIIGLLIFSYPITSFILLFRHTKTSKFKSAQILAKISSVIGILISILLFLLFYLLLTPSPEDYN